MSDQPIGGQQAEAAARMRFFIISGTRLIGAVLVMLAIMVLIGTLDWPDYAGYILLGIGLVDSFVIPQILIRRWSTRGR
ncbi:hypothetical protein [Pontixanthobacter sp.]|uniref:hypothetical protein n=1 Tax=Pontixanthobacter sp. TaxID=2792078 RepID=UPI003C7C43A5